MALQAGLFQWDVALIAAALKITPEDVRVYFTDGRRVSFLLERRIAYEALNGSLAPSEGAGYDVLDANGGKWEVRSVSKGGVYFCPSYMVGSGRRFEEQGFLEKLRDIEGYVVSDIEEFPKVPYWLIPAHTVSEWWSRRYLGTTTKISRRTALVLLGRM